MSSTKPTGDPFADPKDTITDPEVYRDHLLRNLLLDMVSAYMTNYFQKGENDEATQEYIDMQREVVDKAILSFRDIERADFAENYNPKHREEQPF